MHSFFDANIYSTVNSYRALQPITSLQPNETLQPSSTLCPVAVLSSAKALCMSIPFWFLAAAIFTVMESWVTLDAFLLQPFYQKGSWLISKNVHEQYGWLLYTAPKRIIACIAVSFVLIFAASFHSRYAARLAAWRKPALLIACCLALIPLTVSGLKAITGVYSPIDMMPYGGEHPYMGFLTQLSLFHFVGGGQSFPAGHASGGFALMSLVFLPISKQAKKVLFSCAFSAGWLMGLYQMARGQHFLSHTLVTLCLAAGMTLLLARIIGVHTHDKP